MGFDGRRVAGKGDKVRCQKYPGLARNVIEEGDEKSAFRLRARAPYNLRL